MTARTARFIVIISFVLGANCSVITAAPKDPLSEPHGRLGKRNLLQDQPLISSENVDTIEDVIGGLAEGGVLSFESGKIQLSETINVNSSLTIRGAVEGSNPLTILQCVSNTSAIEVRGTNVTIENVIIEDCIAPAISLVHPKFLDSFALPEGNFSMFGAIITNAVFRNNGNSTTYENGGAIRTTGGWDLSVIGSTFVGNEADSGGAIFSEGSTLSISGSKFENNVAAFKGGAVCIEALRSSEEPKSSLRITDTDFIKNRNLMGGVVPLETVIEDSRSIESAKFLEISEPVQSGGALFALNMEEITIKKAKFLENRAMSAGGAIFLAGGKKTVVESTSFVSNRVLEADDPFGNPESQSLSLGGAIFLISPFPGTLEITESEFRQNRANHGGALHFLALPSFRASIRFSSFVRNEGLWGGGAGVFRRVHTNWVGNNVRGNVGRVGGGLMILNGATFFMQSGDLGRVDGSFEGNYALGGGAIMLYGAGEIKIQAAEFIGNRAMGLGGAIAVLDGLIDSLVLMEGVQFEGNSAEQGGAVGVLRSPNVAVSAFSTLEGTRGSILKGNVALDGGALFYSGITSTGNFLQVKSARFENNTALEEMDEIKKLNKPAADELSRVLGDDTAMQELENLRRERLILDPGGRPYGAGCGGAMCLDLLSGGLGSGGIQVAVQSSVFERNRGSIGGAMMIVTAGDGWTAECPPLQNMPLGIIGCRSIRFENSTFDSNRASGAGGAIFTSDARRIWLADPSKPSLPKFSIFDKPKAFTSPPWCIGNEVAGKGFGKHVATEVAEMMLDMEGKREEDFIVENHASGEHLPEIRLSVFDGLNQLMTAGIPSARIAVDVVSDVVVGESLSEAKDGKVKFQNILAIALPGNHSMSFVGPEGFNIPAIDTEMSIRDCYTGEERQKQKGICRKCPDGFYSFLPEEICRPCPKHGSCPGGAALIPVDGYWHSTPFSPHLHECLIHEACAYDMRNLTLLSFYTTDIVPSANFLPNDNHTQCGLGYRGILCGSCDDGFGKQHGNCKKCLGKSSSRFYIACAGFWSLILLGITIRSAMISISEMDQMTTFLEQAASVTPGPPAETRESDSRSSSLHRAASTSRRWVASGDSSRVLGSKHANDMIYRALFDRKASRSRRSTAVPDVEATIDELSELEALGGASGEKMGEALGKIRPIIAAENLSETLKIWTNYLQVTSFAIEINSNWTTSIKEMLAVQDLIAGFSSAEALVSAECAIGDNPSLAASAGASLLRISYPAILFTVIASLFFLVWLFQYRKKTENMTCLWRNWTIVVIAVLFFTYIELSEEFMRSINCLHLDRSDSDSTYAEFSIATKWYWAEDTDLRCFDGDHNVVAAVGIIGLVIITFGIPVALLFFMLGLRQRKELFQHKYMDKYGFVYQAYKQETCYWEVVILLRKALIVGAVVYMRPLGGNMQAILALGVLNVALIFHMVYRPYKYSHLNHLESASLIISIGTVYSGLLFNEPRTTFGGRVTVSVVVMLANVGMFLFLVFRAVLHFDRYSTSKLMSYGKSVPGNPLLRYVKFFTYFVLTSLPKSAEMFVEEKIDVVMDRFRKRGGGVEKVQQTSEGSSENESNGDQGGGEQTPPPVAIDVSGNRT
ncbi:hypothetical protein BSKO_08260 [Bryopsis sp. KO-2023]|nr:hypothetical protein BSKO_08260 [Bryopsis sp. KO-2023]